MGPPIKCEAGRLLEGGLWVGHREAVLVEGLEASGRGLLRGVHGLVVGPLYFVPHLFYWCLDWLEGLIGHEFIEFLGNIVEPLGHGRLVWLCLNVYVVLGPVWILPLRAIHHYNRSLRDLVLLLK